MIKTRDVLTVLLAGTVVFGVGSRSWSLEDLAAPVTDVTDEIVSAARSVSARTPGRHLGFDTSKYPGDTIMQAWREDGSYEWVGYYLPAPCHRDDGWSGKRQMLTDAGWGVAVVYVGQQTWGKTPGKPEVVTKYVNRRVKHTIRGNGKRVTRYVTKRVPIKVTVQPRATPGSSCSAQYVSGPRGRAEADDAIGRAEAEGFAKGTVIFLDIERMDNVPSAMREYYTAWTKRVLEDGRYRPGFYAHTHNAALLYEDVKGAYAVAGASGEPPFWVAGNTSEFAAGKAPTDVGHAFAAVWQGILDKVEERNGFKLPIDVNVAATPSPSTHITD